MGESLDSGDFNHQKYAFLVVFSSWMSDNMMSCKGKDTIGDDDKALYIIVAMEFIKACRGSRIENIVKNNVVRLFDKRDLINGLLLDDIMEDKILKLFTRTFVYSRANLRIVELAAAMEFTARQKDQNFSTKVVENITGVLMKETRKIVKSPRDNNPRYVAKFCKNVNFFVEFMEVAELCDDDALAKKLNGVLCDIYTIFGKKINREECPRRQLLGSKCQGDHHDRCPGIPHGYNCPLKATNQCKGEDCKGVKCSVLSFLFVKHLDRKLLSFKF